jgi:dihydrofolate synthase/folylpolyglutamate synthase
LSLERLFALENFGIKLGLQNMQTLCAALGHPERSFASLHVAGTNGKGSVTAFTHRALLAGGIRTARYASPHLVDLSERFVVGHSPVDAGTLQQAADDVLAVVDQLTSDGTLGVTPTFFEVTTAMAFEMFRRAGVEVAVIEVGLGGRFDATNVITPVAGAITTIGMDHQQHLGSTIAAIAREKAGIIKSGVPIVIGDLPADAMAVVHAVADEQGAPVVEARAGVRADVTMEEGRARMTLDTPGGRYGPLTLSLRGAHQVANAIVATRLLESARTRGVTVSNGAIEQALASTDWPARLELFTLDPARLEGGRRVLLDAAHNADGADALAAYLRQWHPEKPTLVISVMRDKDIEEILAALVPVTSRVIVTHAPSPRAIPEDELARRIAALQRRLDREPDVTMIPDPAAAVAAALERSSTVCVAGSIFLAGAVRDALNRRAILH